MRRVVVSGIGIVSPIGIGAASFWQNLLEGKSGIDRIKSFDPAGFPCQIGGEVPAYPLTMRLLRQIDPTGTQRASDEMTEVARSVSVPNMRTGASARSTIATQYGNSAPNGWAWYWRMIVNV